MALVCLVAGCGKSGSQNGQSGPAGNWEQLVMHPFRDARGTVIVEMPFPSMWKIMANHQPGEPTIVGPKGIKGIDFPAQNFLYTSDPRMPQSYRLDGQQLPAMPGFSLLGLVRKPKNPTHC